MDVVENLAISRAKELFGCEYANVQPHSGAQANMAVQFAICKPGDTIMGMNLDHGGHLTHGSPVNMSGKYFHIVPYGVNDEWRTRQAPFSWWIWLISQAWWLQGFIPVPSPMPT